MTAEFIAFPKIPRLKRGCVITEKIDGTNAAVIIEGDDFACQSRNRIITPESDNYGFAAWAYAHRDELVAGLGDGHHYGEWWGAGIQRGYGLDHKRFSLFNVGRWTTENPPPSCCHVVPILYQGDFDTDDIDAVMSDLEMNGSAAAPGFMKPEGAIIFHTASRTLFKWTFEHDAAGKEAPDAGLQRRLDEAAAEVASWPQWKVDGMRAAINALAEPMADTKRCVVP